MSTFETILITAFAVTIALAPAALDAWLARLDAAQATHEQSPLQLAVGGAE
jgi:hypothetical protein